MNGRRSSGIVATLWEAFKTQLSPQALTILSFCGDCVMKASGISRMIALMFFPACASLPL